MSKPIKSMTKAELIGVIKVQDARLSKAKFYFRQQRDKIAELTGVNKEAVKLLSKVKVPKYSRSKK